VQSALAFKPGDNRTVYQYLQKHGLKYHPLWDQGYLSVGDTHTTLSLRRRY
jgi:phosphoadenosine phosphosulfate reductase